MLGRAVPPALAALLTVLASEVWGQQPAPTIRVPGVARPVPVAATKLDLAGQPVTDAGLKALAGLKGLAQLDLGHTGVTDAGVKELATLKGLTKLSLGHTGVTDAGVKELA